VEYTETFKRKMIQRMLGPGAKSANQLSKEVDVHQVTLSRWKREAATLTAMAPVKPPPSTAKTPRSALEKLRLVLEADKCSPDELGAFLRREGLHEADLVQWRQTMTDALDGRSMAAASERGGVKSKRIRELERELLRKERALAEAAALLILQKKVRALWGDEDDDTKDGSDT
jgi:transposase